MDACGTRFNGKPSQTAFVSWCRRWGASLGSEDRVVRAYRPEPNVFPLCGRRGASRNEWEDLQGGNAPGDYGEVAERVARRDASKSVCCGHSTARSMRCSTKRPPCASPFIWMPRNTTSASISGGGTEAVSPAAAADGTATEAAQRRSSNTSSVLADVGEAETLVAPARGGIVGEHVETDHVHARQQRLADRGRDHAAKPLPSVRRGRWRCCRARRHDTPREGPRAHRPPPASDRPRECRDTGRSRACARRTSDPDSWRRRTPVSASMSAAVGAIAEASVHGVHRGGIGQQHLQVASAVLRRPVRDEAVGESSATGARRCATAGGAGAPPAERPWRSSGRAGRAPAAWAASIRCREGRRPRAPRRSIRTSAFADERTDRDRRSRRRAGRDRGA